MVMELVRNRSFTLKGANKQNKKWNKPTGCSLTGQRIIDKNSWLQPPCHLHIQNIKMYMKDNSNLKAEFLKSSSFEGHELQVRHKQAWSRGFILLLPQTAALPESNAGSDVIKPASSFVIQNRQTSWSMWCPMYRARCQYMISGLLRGATLAIR